MKSINAFCLILFLWVLKPVAGVTQPALFTPEMDSVLASQGMDSTDFTADRLWAEDDSFRLKIIEEALESPQAAYASAHRLIRSTPASVGELALVARLGELLDADCPQLVYDDIDQQLAAAPGPSVDPFEPVLSAFALAEGYRSQAFDSLSTAQQSALLIGAPLWFEDETQSADDSLKGSLYRAFGLMADTSVNIDADSVLTLLYHVNRDALAAAVYAFARGLQLTVARWHEGMPALSETNISGVTGSVLAHCSTDYGEFVIGGPGDNTYERDFALIIDIGGNDRYLDRVGSAVGGIRNTVSAVIDFSGNDVYGSGQMADQACGVLGLGGLFDLGGDDVYRCAAFGQAASFCGAAILLDGGGNDFYQGGLFTQGAAVCGISLLIDEEGRDTYDSQGFCQGYASTLAIGALTDGGGNDLYRAGGSIKHEPLRPEDYRSFAQGFAVGFRPRAGGGLALLRDREGNDFYLGEIYAQGTAYWYSLGVLLDEDGNDVYSATQYAQGAGIHLAAGVLEDLGGDDRYGSRYGPGQGGAHDLSVAVLREQSGDDQYTISGGQGMAITNSASIFLDIAGNDFYGTTENSYSQGGTRPARDFGNLALFMDLEGRDVYSGTLPKDSSLWLFPLYGIGCDVSYDSLKPREAPVEVTLEPADTLRSIEDLFTDASLWEVTDNRERVRRARLALTAKGIPAVRWVGENKLNTLSGLERRTIEELFKAYPDSAAVYLYRALDSGDYYGRRNAVAVFKQLKYKPAARALIDKLSQSDYRKLRPGILSALGDIGDTTALSWLIAYSISDQERERIAATVSLGKMAEPDGYDAVFDRLDDTLYTVRSAAAMAIGSLDERFLPRLKSAELRSVDKLESLLLGVSLLAERWKKDDQLSRYLGELTPVVRKYLEHPLPRVKGAALVAAVPLLEEKMLSKYIQKIEKADDPVLQARIRQVKTQTE